MTQYPRRTCDAPGRRVGLYLSRLMSSRVSSVKGFQYLIATYTLAAFPFFSSATRSASAWKKTVGGLLMAEPRETGTRTYPRWMRPFAQRAWSSVTFRSGEPPPMEAYPSLLCENEAPDAREESGPPEAHFCSPHGPKTAGCNAWGVGVTNTS